MRTRFRRFSFAELANQTEEGTATLDTYNLTYSSSLLSWGSLTPQQLVSHYHPPAPHLLCMWTQGQRPGESGPWRAASLCAASSLASSSCSCWCVPLPRPQASHSVLRLTHSQALPYLPHSLDGGLISFSSFFFSSSPFLLLYLGPALHRSHGHSCLWAKRLRTLNILFSMSYHPRATHTHIAKGTDFGLHSVDRWVSPAIWKAFLDRTATQQWVGDYVTPICPTMCHSWQRVCQFPSRQSLHQLIPVVGYSLYSRLPSNEQN